MSQYKLISTVQGDVGELPVQLPVPDSINTGGFCIPTPSGSVYTYSQIDLLVAGLEGELTNQVIYNLVRFFDNYRGRSMLSEYRIYLTVRGPNFVTALSISEWKAFILINKCEELLKVMRKNAPLTFKWVKIEE